jgi:3,4-dihydroxy-2-butanone 4-phosphate synthase
VNAIEELLAELRAGRMVVVMDDEERENEGDLLMAAACVRPEDINFMARHGRGLICLTLTESAAGCSASRRWCASRTTITAPTSRSALRQRRA